jgi:hypothetical protein
MSTERLIQELSEQISRAEELMDQMADQINRLKEIRDGLDVRPGAHLFHSVLDEPKSQFLRIAEALISKGNRPITARAIMRSAGVSRSSLSQILHRTHREAFESFPMPGYSRKKVWKLSEAGIAAVGQLGQLEERTLFGTEGEFRRVKAVDCCAQILRDHGNEPMVALTMAREALNRGYRGRASGSPDEVLLTTAKSFWASLTRDKRFEEVRPLVFVLRNP